MTHKEMFGNAEWVSPGNATDTPYIRGIFRAPAAASAKVRICGLGMFELYINGQRVGDDLFLPLNSYFHRNPDMHCTKKYGEELGCRIYAVEYDVAKYLHAGENCIGVALGPGWYSTTEPNRATMRFGDVKLCYNIVLTDAYGNKYEYFSNGSEKWIFSPLKRCDFFCGEEQDWSRAVPDGWNELGFDDTDWNEVKIIDPPESDYYLSDCPADKIIRRIKPRIVKITPEKKLYDIGENISGLPVFTCPGEPCTVEMRLSEALDENGNLSDRYSHGQKSVFHTDGSGREYRTKFMWNAFRYIEVPACADVVDCAVVHADVENTSAFECSNPAINWIYDAFIRTQLSNMHCGIPSDCPHIERKGYTGDGQLTCETVLNLLDAQTFYRKWLYDIFDCQDRKSGHVQYTAPYTHCGGGPGGWGGAIIEVPYVYYKIFGDKSVLSEFLPSMLRYFEYLEAHSEKGLIVSDQPGEWCLGDWATAEKIAIPEPYINGYFYIKYLGRMVEIAKLLDSEDLALSLEKHRDEKIRVLLDKYYDSKSGNFAGNVQGANLFAVDLNLGDERAFEHVVDFYSKYGMFDAGIFGTDLLIKLLFERGHGDLAVKLLSSEGKYSFGNWKNQGATTLWEHWDGDRSLSHPMFGAVVRYFFYYILGIRQAPNSAGWEKIIVEPHLYDTIDWATGHLTTPRGLVGINYGRDDKGIRLTVTRESDADVTLIFEGKKYPISGNYAELVLPNC